MKQHIKETAIRMIQESGLINLSRQSLCDRAGLPDGSFYGIMGISFTEFIADIRKSNPDLELHNYHIIIRERNNPELRKHQILMAAIDLAKTQGYNKMTRDAIAEHAGVSMGLVSHRFNTMCQLRRDIIRYAIKHEILPIIAQGLACNDKHALKTSSDLKRKAVDYIINY